MCCVFRTVQGRVEFWSLFFGHDIDDYFVVFRPGSILKDQKLALQQPRWYFQKNQIQQKLGLNMIEWHFNVSFMLLFFDTWEILRGKPAGSAFKRTFWWCFFAWVVWHWSLSEDSGLLSIDESWKEDTSPKIFEEQNFLRGFRYEVDIVDLIFFSASLRMIVFFVCFCDVNWLIGCISLTSFSDW